MIKHISFVLFCGILGYLLGTQIGNISGYQGFFGYLQYVLLAIGLYGAVYGIDLSQLKGNKRYALLITTIGVMLKILFIGGVLFLITGLHISWLLGAILAQIDPLSTAKLSQSSSLSPQGKSFLNIRASFDDPMTVLIALYCIVPFVFGGGEIHMISYIEGIILNIGFAGVFFILNRVSKYSIYHLGLLCIAGAVAVSYQWMLGIALIALFLRPQINGFDNLLGKIVNIAFYLSVLLLGCYLSIQTIGNIRVGVLLGILAYLSHFLVTHICVHTLPVGDKYILGFAQYNGITSIILATSLWSYDTRLVPMTAIAIVVITLLYSFCNSFLLSGSNK